MAGHSGSQQPGQTRPALPPIGTLHRNPDRALLPDDHREPLTAHDVGVEHVPLQHRVVLLGGHRHHHGRVLGPLRLVNRRGVGRNERAKFAEAVDGHLAREVGDSCAASNDLRCLLRALVGANDIG